MVLTKVKLRNTDVMLNNSVRYFKNRALQLLNTSGLSTPPFLPRHYAHFQGIKRIVNEDLGNISGLLIPLREGFEIKINATHSPQKQNYSCAHEIAHTFFLEEKGELILERLNRVSGGNRNLEEILCEVTASELLMPYRVFHKHALEYNFGIGAITHLSRIFDTAIVPTAIKLCEVNPQPCFLVCWNRDNTDDITKLILRPSWLTRTGKGLSAKTGNFVFRPKSFGPTSGIIEAFKSNTPTFSRERINLNSFSGIPLIWSQGFESGEYRYVLSMVFPERNHS